MYIGRFLGRHAQIKRSKTIQRARLESSPCTLLALNSLITFLRLSRVAWGKVEAKKKAARKIS